VLARWGGRDGERVRERGSEGAREVERKNKSWPASDVIAV
jgi:hypothetical protein